MDLVVFRYSDDGKVIVVYQGKEVCKQNTMLQASKAFYKYMKVQV